MTVDQLWALVVTLIAVAVVATLKAVEVVEQKKLINKQLTDLRAEFEALNQQVKNSPLQCAPAAAHKPPPTFDKLDPLKEKIILILAHNTDYITSEEVASVADVALPLCLFHLESMKRLKYAQDNYSHHGRQWICDELGRAYLAHHNLL